MLVPDEWQSRSRIKTAARQNPAYESAYDFLPFTVEFILHRNILKTNGSSSNTFTCLRLTCHGVIVIVTLTKSISDIARYLAY